MTVTFSAQSILAMVVKLSLASTEYTAESPSAATHISPPFGRRVVGTTAGFSISLFRLTMRVTIPYELTRNTSPTLAVRNQDHVIVECSDPVEGNAGVRRYGRWNCGEVHHRTSVGCDLEDIFPLRNVDKSSLAGPGTETSHQGLYRGTFLLDRERRRWEMQERTHLPLPCQSPSRSPAVRVRRSLTVACLAWLLCRSGCQNSRKGAGVACRCVAGGLSRR